jgi:hypothetical protein
MKAKRTAKTEAKKTQTREQHLKLGLVLMP